MNVAYYFVVCSLSLLAQYPATALPVPLAEERNISFWEESDGEALSLLHEKAGNLAMEYLRKLKAGDTYGASRISYLGEDQDRVSLQSSLDEVYRMSTLSQWDVVSGWPFNTEDGSPGFIYRVKVKYKDSHYFLMTGVVILGEEMWIVGGLSPENMWPSALRAPSVPNPEVFAMGMIED